MDVTAQHVEEIPFGNLRVPRAEFVAQPRSIRDPLRIETASTGPQTRRRILEDMAAPATRSGANRPTVILEQAPNITIRTCTTLAAVHGEGRLEAITLRSPDALIDEQADVVFVMIGAQPHTRWLPQTIARDGAGYILTGTDIPPKLWSEERPPFPHETSLAGVFAVGDVRAGSLKRVASAVGDGSVCIQQIHQYLSLTRHPGAMHETETA